MKGLIDLHVYVSYGNKSYLTVLYPSQGGSMLGALVYYIVNRVANESTPLALLRIRATKAMSTHNIRGRSRSAHSRRSRH